ncbi:hypothetical protein [Dactylosporangium salmoneum]|uniref:Uncharacterized protein n=1 Tax=Dactylosporangium salmoneum TaxID=53361 RepID=A0ABP5TI75_9ACTN
MTYDAITLYLPCEVRRFYATLADPAGTGPIEKILLEALATGPLTIGDLTKLFALPRALVATILHGLWRAGDVSVDPASGSALISEDALAAVRSGDPLPEPTNLVERHVDLMVDRILGEVLPASSAVRSTERHRVDPPGRSTGSPEISQSEFRRIAERELMSLDAGDEVMAGRRVVDLVPTPGPFDRRWRAVLVRVWMDARTGLPAVTIVDPRITPPAREIGSIRLSQLVVDHPNAPFVSWLRRHAHHDMPEVLTAPAMAETLQERASRLSSLEEGQRAGHHSQLLTLARQLESMRLDGLAHEAAVEVVTGARVRWAAAELIDLSHTQVVVLLPDTDAGTRRILETRLRQAVQRGVQTVVLFGGLPASGQMPACLIARDDETALVVAGPSLGAEGTLGVLVSAADGGACQVVQHVLSWMETAASATGAGAVLCRPSGREVAAQPETALETLPEEPPAKDPAAAAAWATAWRTYADAVRAAVDHPSLPRVRWITDANPYGLPARALHNARRRLVFASVVLSDQVVDERFLSMLRARLSEGVMVTLAYESARGAVGSLISVLADEFNGNLVLISTRPAARVLVWDDEAIVFSMDPLGEAVLAGGSVPGLHVAGAAFADLLAATAGEPAVVTGQVTGQVTGTTDESGPQWDLLARSRAHNIAQRMRNRWHETGSVERALEPLADAADPWEVLEGLVAPANFTLLVDRRPGSEIETDDLAEAAVAWCLSARSDDDASRRWLQWLIAYHWEAGRFAEAGLLRLSYRVHARPRPSLAVVAAAFGTDVSTIALLAATDVRDRTPEETAALFTVALAESLRTTDDDFRDVVQKLLPAVGSPWSDLGRAILGYHGAAPGIPPELVLHPLAKQAARDNRLSIAWGRLGEELRRAQGIKPSFTTLHRLVEALFRDPGPFHALDRAIERRDTTAVREMLLTCQAVHGPVEKAAGRVIDGLWAQVRRESGDLVGRFRQAPVSRVAGVLTAAREVVAAAESSSAGSDLNSWARNHDAARTLAGQISALLPSLDEALATLERPESVLVAHAVRRIRRMTVPEES